MGIAAYNRGSALMSRQFARERGEPVDRVIPDPIPRPDGWGDKAAARALNTAHRILDGARRYGRVPPDESMLSDLTRELAKVGRATADRAARAALEMTMAKPKRDDGIEFRVTFNIGARGRTGEIELSADGTFAITHKNASGSTGAPIEFQPIVLGYNPLLAFPALRSEELVDALDIMIAGLSAARDHVEHDWELYAKGRLATGVARDRS